MFKHFISAITLSICLFWAITAGAVGTSIRLSPGISWFSNQFPIDRPGLVIGKSIGGYTSYLPNDDTMKSPTFDLGFRLTVDIDTIPLLTLSPGFKANYSFTGLSDAMSKYSKDLKNSSSCQSYSCLFTTTSGSATAQFGLWLKAHLPFVEPWAGLGLGYGGYWLTTKLSSSSGYSDSDTYGNYGLSWLAEIGVDYMILNLFGVGLAYSYIGFSTKEDEKVGTRNSAAIHGIRLDLILSL